MTFTSPIPFSEALGQLLQKKLLPTALTSEQLRALGGGVLRSSFTSAQTTLTGLLDEYKKGVESVINPEQVARPGQPMTVTEGPNPAALRTFVKDYLKQIDYQPTPGEEGTIKDLSSDQRINLVVKTNVEMAHGAGKYVKENSDPDVVDLYPALELVRFENRKEPREWPARWSAAVGSDPRAAGVFQSTGRMVALKSSPVWQALGNGVGGYDDTLSNPFPPFAFNSGMWTEEMSRQEAEDIGLLNPGETAQPAALNLEGLFKLI